MNKIRLITSRILDLFEANSEYCENLFIDDFCYFDLNENVYSNRPHSKIEPPDKDGYEYLYIFHKEILNELHLKLNLLHGVNYSIRFWRILLDPWLSAYIDSTYEKFERINKIDFENLNLDFIFFDNLKNYPTCFDYAESEHQMRGVLYSQYVYQSILSTQYKEQIDIKFQNNFKDTNHNAEIDHIKKNKKLESLQISNKFSIKKNIIKPIIILFDKILSIFFFKFKAVFIRVNMAHWTYIWLQLKLLQMPRYFFSELTLVGEKNKFNKTLRDSIQIDLKGISKFEDFIYKDISCKIPICIIEDFSRIQYSIKKINIVSKNIVFDNILYGDFYIKAWLAFCSLNENITLISHQHGGSMPLKRNDYNFEAEISDIHATWHIPIHKKDKQLPPIKLNSKSNINKGEGKFCLLVPYANQWNAKNDHSFPIGIAGLDHIDQYYDCFQNLTTDIQKNFSVKPDNNYGMNEEKIMRELIPTANFITDKNLFQSFEFAKIILCTYPETTFIEALATGKATILIFPKNHWEIDPKFQELVNRLEKGKIIFYDGRKAADHVNEIWNNPLAWWDSKETRKLRELTFKMLGNPNDKDWIKIWKELLIK